MAPMWTLVFFACLLGSFLFEELRIRARLAMAPQSAFEFMSAFQRKEARRIISLAQTYCGLRLSVTRFSGRLPAQCLVISNHQSLADIPMLMRVLPGLNLRFVAKRELRRGVPAVSTTLRAAQHALIGRRSGYAEARRTLRRLADLTSSGVSPVVFPEGTRSRTGGVGKFQTAAVRILAEATGLPILSVAIDGGYRIASLDGLWRNIRGVSYRIAPLTLYPPAKTRAELAALMASAREEIIRTVSAWRGAEGPEADALVAAPSPAMTGVPAP